MGSQLGCFWEGFSSKVTGQVCEEHSYHLLTQPHTSAWDVAAV